VTSKTSETARALLSADAVREAARYLLVRAQRGEFDWEVRLEELPACADYVAAIIRKRYPSLDVPFHARWRHFVFGGRDLWNEIAARATWADANARARAEFDLAITSVLLDAGAGGAWRYEDSETGISAARSEGLALASLRLFEWGGFSTKPADPLRADAQALARFDVAQLADAFQATPVNPLTGLDGRVGLLNRLASRVDTHADMFARADEPRPGGLYDKLASETRGGELPANVILVHLLEAFGPIWGRRTTGPVWGQSAHMDGVSLGDCWGLGGYGFVPLHKLSQWMAYSLIEPLERAGVRVVEINGLTGLAEYRNGGLFVDMGVLIPRDASALSKTHDVSDGFVVTWRSLTVALLDRIAPMVRERLGVSAEAFPLARVLEGGTWAAGRAIAREKRIDGSPPLLIHSDGTVF
jgi:hypothetical protein